MTWRHDLTEARKPEALSTEDLSLFHQHRGPQFISLEDSVKHGSSRSCAQQ